jgi:hypothetical protein
MICDICNNTIKGADFYILPTSQVVYSSSYLKHLLELMESRTPRDVEKHPLRFLQVVEKLCKSQSNWAVCPNCIRYFDVDRNNAKKLAENFVKTGKHAPIPGSGAVSEKPAFLCASVVWREMYGSELMELLRKPASGVDKEADDSTHVFHVEPGTKRQNIRRILKWFERL